jgi:hypothetical protein
LFSVSKKSRNTVHIYNAHEAKWLQSLLTNVGVHSKLTEDLGVVNAGDLCVCVVSECQDFDKLVKELNKGSVKNSKLNVHV